ncbi:MAG: DUF433 domain-containing protein [Acidobacteriota bacterium]|nr:DUF433 domain-containing protein [Acidobacteriota bacterium]
MEPLVQNVFDTPAYSCIQAAHYVGVPRDTLRHWIGTDGLITTPAPSWLSFNNLAEAHVLKAMRKTHSLPLQRIRKALNELKLLRRTDHPLLDEAFETDGVSLCIREGEDVVNLTYKGQKEIREFVSLYLHRVARDKASKVTHLYPFIVTEHQNEPKNISISPTISFGRPVLAGTGISTAVIAGRFNSRESVADLALEYQVAPAVLEDAIRWEMNRGNAA